MKIDRKRETKHEEDGRICRVSRPRSFPVHLLSYETKDLRNEWYFHKRKTYGFDRDYKLLSPVHSSNGGECLPVVGIYNSQNETVNYFSSKVSKPLLFTFQNLPFCQSDGLANTEENCTRNGRSLIFAASNPQDE